MAIVSMAIVLVAYIVTAYIMMIYIVMASKPHANTSETRAYIIIVYEVMTI